MDFQTKKKLFTINSHKHSTTFRKYKPIHSNTYVEYCNGKWAVAFGQDCTVIGLPSYQVLYVHFYIVTRKRLDTLLVLRAGAITGPAGNEQMV